MNEFGISLQHSLLKKNVSNEPTTKRKGRRGKEIELDGGGEKGQTERERG